MDMGQSQLTVLEVQLKIKMIKKFKKPTAGCFPLMYSSGGVKQKQNRKTPQYISHSPPRTPEALWRDQAQANP